MTDLDEPYAGATEAEGQAHDVHHHLSPWPIVVGSTAMVFPIGVALNSPWVSLIGIALTLWGLVGWVREDYLAWPEGENPLTMHTIGEKNNGWWGVMLFLATEVVLFGSLFAVFFASRAHINDIGGEWPAVHLPVGIVTINTAILVSSGFVMMWGERGLKHDKRGQFKLGFIGAILLGSVFLAIQVNEYLVLIEEGLTLSSGIYGSIFYMLTGTHGFHVLGGLIFLTIVLIRGWKGNFDAERHTAMTGAGIYWHFVDIVWILLYLTVYVQVI